MVVYVAVLSIYGDTITRNSNDSSITLGYTLHTLLLYGNSKVFPPHPWRFSSLAAISRFLPLVVVMEGAAVAPADPVWMLLMWRPSFYDASVSDENDAG